MSQEHKPITFNGPLEAGIRAVSILGAAYPQTYDLQRLVALDWVPAEFGKNRTLSRAMCLRASALKRMVPRTSEKRAKAQRHRRP
ncbi:ABC-three component system middle component 2 [Stutzerimonas kunmingensis]|uniref:ABC-three component system middle component 2 n=1 Tax=Stutzerimonas kunmingensis TaxID=1211807 RepID=UPI003AB22B1C